MDSNRNKYASNTLQAAVHQENQRHEQTVAKIDSAIQRLQESADAQTARSTAFTQAIQALEAAKKDLAPSQELKSALDGSTAPITIDRSTMTGTDSTRVNRIQDANDPAAHEDPIRTQAEQIEMAARGSSIDTARDSASRVQSASDKAKSGASDGLASSDAKTREVQTDTQNEILSERAGSTVPLVGNQQPIGSAARGTGRPSSTAAPLGSAGAAGLSADARGSQHDDPNTKGDISDVHDTGSRSGDSSTAGSSGTPRTSHVMSSTASTDAPK